jgi:hypothetical protein
MFRALLEESIHVDTREHVIEVQHISLGGDLPMQRVVGVIPKY